MTKNQLKDLAVKALNTFWQAFAVVFVLPLDVLNVSAWETTIVAGTAAGLSALKTFVLGVVRDF